MNDDDFTGWYLQTHEGMAMRELSPPAARILDVFLKTSFLIERHEARVPVLQELAAAVNMHKGNLARYIRELEVGDVIAYRYDDADSCSYYKINPDWTAWKIPRRYTYKEEAVMEKALHRLIEIGKSDPRQEEFHARGFERPADFQNEVSRAFASAGVVHGTTDPAQGGPKVVPATTSARVVPRTTGPPHEGIVPCTTSPPCSEHEEHEVQNMIHDHEHASRGDGGEERNPALNALSTSELEARLDDQRRHLLEQMSELPGVTDPKFRRTWLLRILDRNFTSVISAVGEARHKKAIGWKPNTSWGRYLNDLYHRSRNAMRSAAKHVSLWL